MSPNAMTELLGDLAKEGYTFADADPETPCSGPGEGSHCPRVAVVRITTDLPCPHAVVDQCTHHLRNLKLQGYRVGAAIRCSTCHPSAILPGPWWQVLSIEKVPR